jgi:formylglycine-generating enzyme required for sulfatase activity
LRLGKYPVTVEEFRHFVEEGRGYETRELWDEAGWAFREREGCESPDSWDGQLATPNRPVVGVSWYEAMAYCRWLSAQWEMEVRLPTGAEWEAAARPERGEYPWGEAEPDAERANFALNVDRPTPVGAYPEGAGPHGHLDLAGNVWEWCVDGAGGPGEDAADPSDFGPVRALCGGGWYDVAGILGVGARYWFGAANRSDDVGFRLGVPPASPRIS